MICGFSPSYVFKSTRSYATSACETKISHLNIRKCHGSFCSNVCDYAASVVFSQCFLPSVSTQNVLKEWLGSELENSCGLPPLLMVPCALLLHVSSDTGGTSDLQDLL